MKEMTERGRKILEGRRERILKLMKTKACEICLADWQAKIIVEWIEEIEAGNKRTPEGVNEE